MSLLLLFLLLSTEYFRLSLSDFTVGKQVRNYENKTETMEDERISVEDKIAILEEKYDLQLEFLGGEIVQLHQQLGNFSDQREITEQEVKLAVLDEIERQLYQERLTRHRYEREIALLKFEFRSLKINFKSFQMAFFEQKYFLNTINVNEINDATNRLDQIEKQLDDAKGTWIIRLYTSYKSVKGAGPWVYLTIYDVSGHSVYTPPLDSRCKDDFEPNTNDTFVFKLPGSITEPYRIDLWSPDTFRSPAWNLVKVEIVSATGNTFTFSCNCWTLSKWKSTFCLSLFEDGYSSTHSMSKSNCQVVETMKSHHQKNACF